MGPQPFKRSIYSCRMLRHSGQHAIGRGGRVGATAGVIDGDDGNASWTGATAGVIDGDDGNASWTGVIDGDEGAMINRGGGGDGCDASIAILGELTLVCTWEELDSSSALYFKVSSFSCTLDFFVEVL